MKFHWQWASLRLFALSLALILLLAACTPDLFLNNPAAVTPNPSSNNNETAVPGTVQLLQTVTSAPTPTVPQFVLDQTCLEGEWQVTDLNQAMNQSFNQVHGSLQLEKVAGRMLYSFLASGQMRIAFNHLTATFNGQVDQRQVTAAQSLDGSATADYQLDATEGQLTLTDFGGDGMQFSLMINDQLLAQGSLPAWQAFTASQAVVAAAATSASSQNNGQQATSAVESARVSVTCTGDQMTIQALQPIPGPILNLERVQ